MAIDWNVVNNTGEAFDGVSAKVRSKIEKVEKHLAHFPEDAVHLQAILDMNSRSKTYAVALNLRVPSSILHVKKTSKSLVEALDKAVAALLASIAKLKTQYRKAHFWRGREAKAQEAKVFSERPLVEGASPVSFDQLVVQTLEDEYERLLDFAWRQIREYELAGTIGSQAVDARDVVDRVAEEVLRHPRLKPEAIDYGAWCRSLAYRNVQKTVRQHLADTNQKIPVELEVSLQSDTIADDVPEPEDMVRSLIKEQIDPEEELLLDVIPDPSAHRPDVEAADRDMISTLRALLRHWPKMEREIMEMYFFEGFRVEDIAATLQCELKTVKQMLKRVRARLRSRMADIVDTDGGPGVSASDRTTFTAHLATIEQSIASAGNTGS
jgi:RNA polymerase sigma factor (sigma-70 family)